MYIDLPCGFFSEDYLACLQSYTQVVRLIRNAQKKKSDHSRFVYFRNIDKACVSKIETLLAILACEVDERAFGYEYIIRGILIRLLQTIYKNYEVHDVKEMVDSEVAMFKRIDEYIHDHYYNCSLSDLRNEFHYNHDYFNKLIRKYTGQTYTAYLHKIRLEKAADLLIATDWPVSRIIETIGYNNKSYFYKIFTANHGITPNEYRLQYQVTDVTRDQAV